MIELPGLETVWDALPEARMVGGAVRDLLAGRMVADVDFASPLTPQQVMARARAAGLKAVPTGLAHGTVTLVAAGHGFEVTTLRRDELTDGRHARVAFTDDWREDAARRDFTINAMSRSRDGEIFDYFGGRADLAAGIVRFVGPARARIEEDFLRILRFFRFFARYGRGGPDAEAVAAIAAGRGGLARLSAERVWSELKKILVVAEPLAAVRLMAATGVLEMVLPGADVERFAALLARGAPADAVLRVAALTDEAGLAKRLRLSGAEAARLAGLRGAKLPAVDVDEAGLRRVLAAASPALLAAATWLREGDWAGLRARLAEAPSPVFPLAGRDVTALGVAPGPRIGGLLAQVRAWWLEGGCVAGRDECLAQLRHLLSNPD